MQCNVFNGDRVSVFMQNCPLESRVYKRNLEMKEIWAVFILAPHNVRPKNLKLELVFKLRINQLSL